MATRFKAHFITMNRTCSRIIFSRPLKGCGCWNRDWRCPLNRPNWRRGLFCCEKEEGQEEEEIEEHSTGRDSIAASRGTTCKRVKYFNRKHPGVDLTKLCFSLFSSFCC